LKKQILVLAIAASASWTIPAYADPSEIDDITTILTDPIATATAGASGGPADIVIDTDGGLTITSGTAAVTINSNNSFEQVGDTTVSFKNTSSAVGILVDLSSGTPINATNTAGCTPDQCEHVVEGILEQGTVDLSGSGTAKRGLWFEGPTTDDGSTPPPNSYTGNVDLGAGTFVITGDNSIGVLIDPSSIVNGTITLGTMTMQTTSLTGSSTGVIGFENNGVVNGDVRLGFIDDANDIAEVGKITVAGSTASTGTGVVGVDLGGVINGDFVIDSGSSILAAGTGAEGVLLTGELNPCNQTQAPGCTSLGSLINRGSIQTVGTTNPGSNTTGNPISGAALAIGGSVAGGIYNAGKTSESDLTTGASIIGQSFAPVVEISPAFQSQLSPTPIVIGVYTGDTVDPGFSFYNRGSILASPSNYNQSSEAVSITGEGDIATTTLTGGCSIPEAFPRQPTPRLRQRKRSVQTRSPSRPTPASVQTTRIRSTATATA
jgi:hypothetical protein